MTADTDSNLPYAHLLQGRDAAEIMRSTPVRLQTLLAGFSIEQIDSVPAPGKWSLREVMCHIADCEVAWAWRLRQTLAENNPTLQPFEQDAWARAYSGQRFTFARALQAWQAMREWNLAFLHTLSAEDRERPAVHPSAGPVTLWNLVEIAAGHDLHHLAALEKL